MDKIIKTPFFGHGEWMNELLALVHTDVCEPMTTQAREGYTYFITFTDDLSRFGYMYLMKHKSEVFDKFKEYNVWSRNKLKKVSKFFDLIEEENTYPMNFWIILKVKVFSLNGSLLIYSPVKWCRKKEKSYFDGYNAVHDMLH